MASLRYYKMTRLSNVILVVTASVSFFATAWAQDTVQDTSKGESKYISFFRDDDPMLLTLDSEEDDQGARRKKKKKKKNVFYGYKTRAGYVANGFGDRRVVETFRYLKEYQAPDPYARYNYSYDVEKQKIVRHTKVDEEARRVLHGPYEKSIGGVVIEKGYYYKGTKHGRWEKYGKSHEHTYHKGDSAREKVIEYQVLLNKEYYYKGWLTTTELEYYDLDRELLKEATPYNEDHEKHGYYVSYFKNGHKKEYGEYAFGEKIGRWYLYQKGPTRVRRKSIIQYKKRAFDEDVEPVIVKEWDDKGHLIIEDGKEVKNDPHSRMKRKIH